MEVFQFFSVFCCSCISNGLAIGESNAVIRPITSCSVDNSAVIGTFCDAQFGITGGLWKDMATKPVSRSVTSLELAPDSAHNRVFRRGGRRCDGMGVDGLES